MTPFRPLLFDASALMALFNGHARVSALWFDAERLGVSVLLPAASIAAANRWLDASDNAWTALLLAGNVQVLDLTAATALGASRESGNLDVAHAAHEARLTAATVVTRRPWEYPANVATAGF